MKAVSEEGRGEMGRKEGRKEETATAIAAAVVVCDGRKVGRKERR
jgi:hypothetical protein